MDEYKSMNINPVHRAELDGRLVEHTTAVVSGTLKIKEAELR